MPTFVVETEPGGRFDVFNQLSQIGVQNSAYLGDTSMILLRDIWVLSGDDLTVEAIKRMPATVNVEPDQEYVFFVNQAFMQARSRAHEPLPSDIRVNLPLGAFDMSMGRPVDGTEFISQGGLGRMLDLIGAPAAWGVTRGQGATVVILDSGVDGRFVTEDKRAGGWSDSFLDPWEDPFGHGTMMAMIAAGSGPSNGFAGAAPGAKLYSLRPSPGPNGGLLKSGVLKGLEHIIGLIQSGEMGPSVIINGWGIFGCLSPPNICDDVLARVVQAMNRRVCTVWAAGNSRGQCGHLANGIFGYASMPRSLSAGALDTNLRPQPYSSQGPGQCAPVHPTVSVPTFGILPWGGGFIDFGAQGGGTSSGAALLGGAVALLYSAVPEISSQQIGQLLRDSAAPLGGEFGQQIGGGLLQIQRALELVLNPTPTT